jgi:8-oxo-dGTP pyrophosphatase MutT (NUDIX family)
MVERIKTVLANRPKQVLPLNGLMPAAVTVPLFLKGAGWHVLLTRRTRELRHHKGEISFPGGARDKGDTSFLETALRETEEEVGIQRDDIVLLGELDDIQTMSRFRISPFVVAFPYPYPLQICRAEIDEVLEIPLARLQTKARLEEKIAEYEGARASVYYYYYHNIVVWGATAKILKQLLDLIDFT